MIDIIPLIVAGVLYLAPIAMIIYLVAKVNKIYSTVGYLSYMANNKPKRVVTHKTTDNKEIAKGINTPKRYRHKSTE